MKIVYRDATHEDLPEIVRLHIENFPGYFLTGLGESLLSAYYKEFMDEGSVVIIAEDMELESKQKMVGFCLSHYRDSQARDQFEQHNRSQLFKKLLVQCLTFNKDALTRCFGKIKGVFCKKKKTDEGPERDAILLSHCVSPAYRRTPEKIAYNLCKKSEEAILARAPFPIRVYGATTKSDNIAFQKLMKKAGGVVACKSQDNGSYLCLMFYDPTAKQEWIDAGIIEA